MARKFAIFERIENNRPITKETDSEFLFLLQLGLLLAIKERGRLSEMQYRHAREKLEGQRRSLARKRGEINA